MLRSSAREILGNVLVQLQLQAQLVVLDIVQDAVIRPKKVELYRPDDPIEQHLFQIHAHLIPPLATSTNRR